MGLHMSTNFKTTSENEKKSVDWTGSGRWIGKRDHKEIIVKQRERNQRERMRGREKERVREWKERKKERKKEREREKQT